MRLEQLIWGTGPLTSSRRSAGFARDDLDVDLTVSGTVTVPGTEFQIDYQMDQKNKDEWTAIVGANWDINKHWSIQAEYNGFVGSRETWMGSISWRF